MNPQHERHEPLDPEERALARLLADADTQTPSPGLDARILAAARAQSQARPRITPRHRRKRWPVVMGLAASVTLAVGVAWQLREPPLPAAMPASLPAQESPEARLLSPATPDAATAADAAPPPPPVLPIEETAPVPAATRSSAATASDPVQQQRAAVAAATERTAQRQEKALRQAEAQATVEAKAEVERARAHEAGVAAATQRSIQRGEKAARQAAAAAPTSALPPPPPMPVLDVAEPRPTDVYQAPAPPASPAPVSDMSTTVAAPHTGEVQFAPPALAPAPAPATSASASASATFADPADTLHGGDVAAIEADATLPPTQWLQRIRQHRDRGDLDTAQASLARFVRVHPAVPVPEDLQPLTR